MDDRFSFVPGGEQDLHDVYNLVKHRYPDLCDDDFLCEMNCSSGHNRPEWEHEVRRVLDKLKKPKGPLEKPKKRPRIWIFP